MEVWTYQKQPFTMGNSVARDPVKCDVPADGPHELGAGYLGFIVTSPEGRSYVAEKTTGRIMDGTLETLREDIRHVDLVEMARQTNDASRSLETAKMVEPQVFWRLPGPVTIKQGRR